MHSFEQQLAASWPPEKWQVHRVLVAVSGGADSVALLRGMHSLKVRGDGRLLVAHFNHGQRGEASQADEQFVVDLAHRFGIEMRLGRAEAPAGVVSEDSLRDDRYHFLQCAAEQTGARYVVTAHTADDQVETILHRILRGTGISGLAGIRRTRPLGDDVVLLRPLLAVTRLEVIDYLQSLGQPYREDATNAQTDFTRNRIRHELLPLLTRVYNPQVADALRRLGQLAADEQAIVDRATSQWIDRRLRCCSSAGIDIDCTGLNELDRPLLRASFTAIWKRQHWPLADMGFAEWDRLTSLVLASAEQAIDLPGPVRARRQGEILSLTIGMANPK